MVIPSKNRALMVDAEDNNSVCVSDMGQPKLTANHGVLLKVICSGVCSSDVNTYRNAPSTLVSGLPLGHEVVGEVTHLGSAVKKLQLGDIVIVPFNVACGMCENCLRQSTHLCLRANKEMPGATYGHASLDSGWHGGQAEYFFAPWADFNCVKLPDKRLAMQHIFDLTLVTDVLPTALHAAKMAKVSAGKTVFIAGAGPVGIAAAKICRELLGAARVIVGDMNSARLVMLHEMGVDAVDLSRESNLSTALEHILGYPRVDCVLECVGYEQFATTSMQIEQEKLLDYWCQLVNICEFDGKIHVTGMYCPKDPVKDTGGVFKFPLGLLFSKGITMTSGQCPVARYTQELVNCIFRRGFSVYRFMHPKLVSLDTATAAYDRFNNGEPCKFFIDPHNTVRHHFAGLAPPGVEMI